MNKVILMGRLARDPEVRYSQGNEPFAVARYTLAVNKRFKRAGEADADFITCVAFGKTGEFAEKYFRKGQMISIVGRLQVRSWDDQNGQKRYITEVVADNIELLSRKSGGGEGDNYGGKNDNSNASETTPDLDNSSEVDDLPF